MVSMDQKAEASYRGPDLKLFVRDVRDCQGKKRPINVRSWSTIKDVKDVIKNTLQIPTGAQRLYFGPLLTRELPNHRSLHDAGIYRSGETLLMDIKGDGSSSSLSRFSSSIYSLRSSAAGNDVCISSSMMDSTPKALRIIVQEARRAFNVGIKPEFVLDGSGGTYFMHDTRKNSIAVFKPADEEPYAENNPRGYLRQPGSDMTLREGVVPGEACIREVAAYLLDHDGVSSVPMTTLAEARHPAFNTNGARLSVAEGGASIGAHSIGNNSPVKPKTAKKAGSFQEFVKCECTMDDISPSKISVDEIHKIAILDIRIMNADRNAANLMVRRCPDNSLKLVPIDHGYCLRSVSDVSWMDWCWLDWPQLKQPISDKLKKYVNALNIEADARMLSEQLNICQEAIDLFRASSSLLKAGVKAGLTLYDIAILCCRNDNLGEVPSMLEKLIGMASELAYIAIENERWHHAAASRALVEQLSPRHKRRGSTLARMGSSGSSQLCKSVSSTEFRASSGSDFLSVNEGSGQLSLRDALRHEARDSPAMAQSSASDTGSEVEDDTLVEADECEVWAASVILDVSAPVDEAPSPIRRTGRSGSIVSDDCSSDCSNLSSSPRGFWTIRPGSSPLSFSDDASVSWSPQTSPQSTIELGISEALPPPVDFSNTSEFRTPTISFAPSVCLPPGPYIPPPSMGLAVPKNKPVEPASAAAEGPPPPLPRMDSGMSRSKSYAALSVSSSSTSNVVPPKPKADSADYETFRRYFHKFIDLVIVRETTAAVMNSRHVRAMA